MAEPNKTDQAQQDAAARDAAARDAASRRTVDTSRTDDAARRSGDAARNAARARFDEEKKVSLENRPQGVGGNPTPTQAENDEIRNGLRHIDDKEDDGSGPEPRFGMRRIDANAPGGRYETR
jgi:hypothetical protein